jgi:uncharacterized protein
LDSTNPEAHPDVKIVMLIVQGIYSLVGLIIVPWYYLKEAENKNIRNFFQSESRWPIIGLIILIGMFSLWLAVSPVAEWNANFQFPDWMSSFGNWARNLEDLATKITKALTSDFTPLSFIITFIVVAILPAVGEELVFRGLIQTELVRAVKNPHVAIWIGSIIFSAIHLQFYGFIPRMLIGAFLGYLYYWSGNLLIPMLGHFFNNGIQVVWIYLSQLGLVSLDIESTESQPLSLVVVGLLFTFLILYYLRNYFTSRSTSASGPV